MIVIYYIPTKIFCKCINNDSQPKSDMSLITGLGREPTTMAPLIFHQLWCVVASVQGDNELSYAAINTRASTNQFDYNRHIYDTICTHNEKRSSLTYR